MNRDWYAENWEVMAKHGMEEAHTAHCLDLIREALTCRSDIGLMPYRWVNVSGHQFPDFHRPHQCHDFQAARDWSARHAMPRNIGLYLDKQAPPADAIWLEPEFYGASGMSHMD